MPNLFQIFSRGYGSLTETERALLEEADDVDALAHNLTSKLEEPLTIIASADMGFAEVYASQDGVTRMAVAYADRDEANAALLTALNTGWK